MDFLVEKSSKQNYVVTITEVFEKTSKGVVFGMNFKPEPDVTLTTLDDTPEM
ncbi:MAG: hypothetical protein HOP08_13820 [Cyclobacteriaceae bacterium]|nr:hypothetical protein [Cyclobacteriaceae bacterium]